VGLVVGRGGAAAGVGGGGGGEGGGGVHGFDLDKVLIVAVQSGRGVQGGSFAASFADIVEGGSGNHRNYTACRIETVNVVQGYYFRS